MLKTKNNNGPVILVTKDIRYTFPFGYAYLAGYLIEKGEDVKILFRPEKSEGFKKFAEEIINQKPILLGFGTLYPDLYPIKELIKILDEMGRDFPIVIGGQMVTRSEEHTSELQSH